MPKEGPIKEPSYYFPAKKINDFMASLPQTDRCEPLYANIPDRVVVMTHDDFLDENMLKIESEMHISSTFFLLSNASPSLPLCSKEFDVDLQLHFDKEHSTLERQMNIFDLKCLKMPNMNRMHRFLWRSDNFDFPFLASYGFVVDSSKFGITPYRPCIWGKILPIWEVPIAIGDIPPNDTIMATYNVAKDIETLFAKGVTPIVVDAHPFRVVKEHGMISCYMETLEYASFYGYRVMNMTDFYTKYLSKR